MAHPKLHSLAAAAWKLANRQHGVIARWQLLDLGFSPEAIKHRVTIGRLHLVRRGVYAVGRPQLTRRGEWMAALLSCGPDAVLSHGSAAALWGIRSERSRWIHVGVPATSARTGAGLRVHRRAWLTADVTRYHDDIPVTSPVDTLVDLATTLDEQELETAVNEADKRDLVDPESLRAALDVIAPRRGVAKLRSLLDRRTFVLTDSELERRFNPLARRAGLAKPLTQQLVNGFRVDFYWPDLGLVVETDGLRYHRTPAAQARDRLRDQAHTAAGLISLRFTHAQIRYDPGHVEATLTAVACRLQG